MRSSADPSDAVFAIFLTGLVKCSGFFRGSTCAPTAEMNPWGEAMKARTHQFAVDVVTFVRSLPTTTENRRVKDQLVGAACGVSGNYRAACRARSHREFTAKLGTVLEEADEAEGWLDLISDTKLGAGPELRRLQAESRELRAIFARAVLTAKRNQGRKDR